MSRPEFLEIELVDGARALPETARNLHEITLKLVRTARHMVHSGYGRLAVLPYLGGPGYWRCEFHVLGQRDQVLYRYSQANDFNYLGSHCGGTVRKNIKPEALAEAIMISVPGYLRDACAGQPSGDYAAWLDDLVAMMCLERMVPVAHHEYSEDLTNWEARGLPDPSTVSYRFAPYPGYVAPGAEKPPNERPRWRSRLLAWEAIASRTDLVVQPAAVEDEERLEALAEAMWRECHEVELYDAPAALKRVLKAALVLLQPHAAELDATRLIAAMRRVGLSPQLTSLGTFHLVDWPLADPGELDEEGQSIEKLHRLTQALQLLGVEVSAETFAKVDKMRSEELAACLLLERQHGSLEAQKLVTTMIKKAKSS